MNYQAGKDSFADFMSASKGTIAKEIIRSAQHARFGYVCGPRGYWIISSMCPARLPEGRVRLEHFSAEVDVNGDPFVVVAAKSGRAIHVSASDTILAALSRA